MGSIIARSRIENLGHAVLKKNWQRQWLEASANHREIGEITNRNHEGETGQPARFPDGLRDGDAAKIPTGRRSQRKRCFLEVTESNC